MTLPVVTSIAPAFGPTAGGTIVTITGAGLTDAVAVRFGACEAGSIAVASDTQVIAVSPAGAGAQDVTVATPGGRSTANAASLFSYAASQAAGSAYYVDPVLTSTIVGSLVSILSAAADPDALEAQSLLMRRLAQESGAAPAGAPPCGDVADVTGYLALMAQLKERAMRDRTLAAILGSAGAAPVQGGWAATPLSMTAIPNDLPAPGLDGAARSGLPAEVLVRSDFVSFVQAAQKAAHAHGAILPLSSPPAITLPPGGAGAAMPGDALHYLGRTLSLAPQAALHDPATDPLALIRPAGAAGAFSVAARVLTPGAIPVAPADYTALAGAPTACGIVSLAGARFVPLRPLLAAAGFHPAQPANSEDDRWAIFTNVTGLVVGDTMLGDELERLYPPAEIAGSVFAPLLNTVWNGRAFV